MHDKLFRDKTASDLPASLPVYSKQDGEKENTKHQNSRFLSVTHNGQEFYIRKSTAVWLFSEGERVSSDRLIRVRGNQGPPDKTHDNKHKRDSIKVGDI